MTDYKSLCGEHVHFVSIDGSYQLTIDIYLDTNKRQIYIPNQL